MATYLFRLGTTAYRRWPLFLAGWLALLVVIIGAAAGFAKPFNDAFTIPGIPSERAADLQAELFPDSKDAFAQANVNVVVLAPQGSTLDQPQHQRAIDALVADLAALPQVSQDPRDNPQLGNPVELAQAQTDAAMQAAQEAGADTDTALENAQALSPLSADRRAGIIAFDFDVDSPIHVEQGTVDALAEAMDTARDAGLTVEANGAGSQEPRSVGGAAEAVGLAIALLILLLTFGSLVAAGMPILTAVLGVGIGLGGVTAMTALMDLSSSTTALASMIGLAVGIDYTLFILARYRSELRHTGSREQAVGIAAGTAGSAVVFAGLTVLIALAALSVVGIPFLSAMGLAAAGTVLIAVLVALTLLPALLGLTKANAFGGRVRKYRPAHEPDGQVLNNGVRWARAIGKRPLAATLLVVLTLGAMTIPLKDLHLAFPTDSTASTETTQRKASDLMSAHFGPGREGPLLIAVDGRNASDPATSFGEVAAWAAEQDGVANAQVVRTNADPEDPGAAATGALVLVQPLAGPDDTRSQDLLDDLREGQAEVEQQTGTTIGVTGLTAITTDVSDRLADALPFYLAIVVGLAFLLLMVVFRSIMVPLTATLGFLLSVLATLGATVAIFQEGLFGLFEPQPLVSFIPVLLVGIVFGLAMDYQVFLVTRMREAHVHGRSTRDAVVDGFRNSARVVTAAAAIMTAVFSGFILEPDPVIKSLGFALATAVVLDAFIVRMVLIPALMYLMDERAWWLPRWLDRMLPNVDVEGEKLERPHPTKTPDQEDRARSLPVG